MVRSFNSICHYTPKRICNRKKFAFCRWILGTVEKNELNSRKQIFLLFGSVVSDLRLFKVVVRTVWPERTKYENFPTTCGTVPFTDVIPTRFRFISRKNPRVETIEFPRCFRFVVRLRARYCGQRNASGDVSALNIKLGEKGNRRPDPRNTILLGRHRCVVYVRVSHRIPAAVEANKTTL